jgi:hypothetical protein
MKVVKGIEELIGHTPLMEITQFELPAGVRLFAKLEFFNPGGSIKDRLGVELINRQNKRGRNHYRAYSGQYWNRSCPCCDSPQSQCGHVRS